MKNFKIRELEHFTGVKAHTLRIWEQRYSILKPHRSQTNFRTYTLEQVNLLLSIALLNKSGLKISHIAQMNSSEIERKVAQFTKTEERQHKLINNLVIAMFTMDIEEFEFVLDNSLLAWGIHSTLTKVIIPFLERVQILSYSDRSCEVHFVVTAIRKKIILGIEKTNPEEQVEKTALLFLPETEHYDLMLLYMAYRLKCHGLKVLYLGTNISVENLKAVLKVKQPDFLFTYMTENRKFEIMEVLHYLDDHLPQALLVAANYQHQVLQKVVAHNLRIIHPAEVLTVVEKKEKNVPVAVFA